MRALGPDRVLKGTLEASHLRVDQEMLEEGDQKAKDTHYLLIVHPANLSLSPFLSQSLCLELDLSRFRVAAV